MIWIGGAVCCNECEKAVIEISTLMLKEQIHTVKKPCGFHQWIIEHSH